MINIKKVRKFGNTMFFFDRKSLIFDMLKQKTKEKRDRKIKTKTTFWKRFKKCDKSLKHKKERQGQQGERGKGHHCKIFDDKKIQTKKGVRKKLVKKEVIQKETYES